MCALAASNSAQSARRHPLTENHPITVTCSTTRQMLNQRKCDEGPAAPDAPHSVGDWGHRITHSLNDMLHNNTALAGEWRELLACSDTPRDSSRNTFCFFFAFFALRRCAHRAFIHLRCHCAAHGVCVVYSSKDSERLCLLCCHCAHAKHGTTCHGKTVAHSARCVSNR